MAKEIVVKLTDDIDGGEATESLIFGIDGNTYEIDLNAKNAGALRKALDKYVQAGRVHVDGQPRRRGRPAGPKAEREFDPAAVRVWAAENNVTLSPRGRVPREIVEQYKAAGGR